MSFEFQQNIKNNAHEIREYVTELYDWEQEMELKEKAKSKIRSQNIDVIRNEEEEFKKKKDEEERQKREEALKAGKQKKKELIRDANTVQNYYKAWDQFDVDQELKHLEEEETRPYRPYNPYEDSKNYQRAKPSSKMVVKGNRNRVAVKDPTSLKDKGNLHFKVCEYDRAIDYYTQCLDKVAQQAEPNSADNKKLKAIVYSNRAMAYIKINERAKALSDCNQSLKLDDQYMKTYLRRADCLKKLGRYKESLADYKRAQIISPDEPQAGVQIKRLEEFLKKRVKEARDNMIAPIPNALPGGYRIQIEEVDKFDLTEQIPSDKLGKINYLEEL